ncbi:MAG TPA: SpoIIE family protein phosphatase, partial [Bacteroidia bacterium]|nr:SpoIIE family protein phosphatase [Bacteroidia bacterium]
NALNRTVKEFKIFDPGKILDKTRDLVLETFIRNDNSKTKVEVKDGMDISLCSLTISSPPDRDAGMRLQFAGANNSLWIIRGTELTELRADRQPVGKTENPVAFTNHVFQLQKGDSFYLFTDGFSDQFGGPKGKKFMSANLKKLLLSIQDKPMHEQEKIILAEFESWKGTLEQVDDVSVMGVRI